MAYTHNAFMNILTLFYITHAFFTRSPPAITGGLNTHENNKLEQNFCLRQEIIAPKQESSYMYSIYIWPRSTYMIWPTLFYIKHAFFSKSSPIIPGGLNTHENNKLEPSSRLRQEIIASKQESSYTYGIYIWPRSTNIIWPTLFYIKHAFFTKSPPIIHRGP